MGKSYRKKLSIKKKSNKSKKLRKSIRKNNKHRRKSKKIIRSKKIRAGSDLANRHVELTPEHKKFDNIVNNIYSIERPEDKDYYINRLVLDSNTISDEERDEYIKDEVILLQKLNELTLNDKLDYLNDLLNYFRKYGTIKKCTTDNRLNEAANCKQDKQNIYMRYADVCQYLSDLCSRYNQKIKLSILTKDRQNKPTVNYEQKSYNLIQGFNERVTYFNKKIQEKGNDLNKLYGI
tara:strand:- start:225 stop:929 length:705 start_codon:yes stop_codon:yes gene_type:complete